MQRRLMVKWSREYMRGYQEDTEQRGWREGRIYLSHDAAWKMLEEELHFRSTEDPQDTQGLEDGRLDDNCGMPAGSDSRTKNPRVHMRPRVPRPIL